MPWPTKSLMHIKARQQKLKKEGAGGHLKSKGKPRAKRKKRFTGDWANDPRKVKEWIVWQNRRIFRISPLRNRAAKRCRARQGCSVGACGHVVRGDCVIDHLDPVDAVCGDNSLAAMLDRLWCVKDGRFDLDMLQGLCKPCHQKKTNRENAARRKDREQIVGVVTEVIDETHVWVTPIGQEPKEK